MIVVSYELDFYVQRLIEEEPFSLARYGNGEWDCIFKTRPRTGTGSQALNITSLRKGMKKSIITHQKDPNYFLAIQSRGYLERCKLLPSIKPWLRNKAPHAKWHCGETFTHASRDGTLHPLIAQLRKMNLIIVGPPWLKGLKKQVFPSMQFVYVRPKDCFVTYKDLFSGIARAIRTALQQPGPVVVSFSAGPTTKVLIHELHGKVRDRCFLIDFGSLWDPYTGRRTRRYHKRLTAAIMGRNLTGRK